MEPPSVPPSDLLRMAGSLLKKRLQLALPYSEVQAVLWEPWSGGLWAAKISIVSMIRRVRRRGQRMKLGGSDGSTSDKMSCLQIR